jgi:16S rRNA (cytosine967-C5)-methyltransferase
LQRGFIERAALLLRPGGTLIYCVCSLEADEGEQQVEWIARSGLGLEPSPIDAAELSGWAAPLTAGGCVRTHPGLALPAGTPGRLDGFFVARFHKR